MSFEQALKRLESIVESLEEGATPLNDVMKMYEEGITLSKQCMEQLSRAEATLKRLNKDIEGHFKLQDGDE